MPGREIMVSAYANPRLTLESLAGACNLHADVVRRFVAYDLLQPLEIEEGVTWFDPGAVNKLWAIRRLRDDLGINLAGIATVLDLTDRIAELQRELDQLRRERARS
jgi:DNA-binding transcriptional MerR regulator